MLHLAALKQKFHDLFLKLSAFAKTDNANNIFNLQTAVAANVVCDWLITQKQF